MSPHRSDQERWLAESSNALAEAEKLIGMLALTRPRHDLVLAALQAEIRVLRREVERLQRQRSGDIRREFDPKWGERSAWCPPEGAH